MIKKRTILCVVGPRPKVIKMLPVVRALQDSNWTKCIVIVTAQAQQSDILDQMQAHCRENFVPLLQNIFTAVLDILEQYRNVHRLYSVHPNLNVCQSDHKILKNYFKVKLVEQFDYFNYVKAMQSAYLIQTDSNIIQEKGFRLGKPILVLRELTELPKLVTKGVMKLLGSELNNITLNVKMLLDNLDNYQRMIKVYIPYENGKAGRNIASVISRKP